MYWTCLCSATWCVSVCVYIWSINWLRRNLSALLTKFTWNWLKMPQMTIIYTSNTYFVSVSYWRSLFRNGIVADIAALGPQKPRTSVGRNVCVWFCSACEHYLCASTRVSVDIHCFLHMNTHLIFYFDVFRWAIRRAEDASTKNSGSCAWVEIGMCWTSKWHPRPLSH